MIDRMPNLRAVSGRLCQACDMLILCVAFAAVAILPLYRSDVSLQAFVQDQISVRGLLVAVICIATWFMILLSVGMYKPARSFAEYGLRCFIGLNCCTAVLGLIELVLKTVIDVWRFVAIFWLVSGVLMALLRLALFLTYRPRRPGLSSSPKKA